jgi:predicted transcriptional regulator
MSTDFGKILKKLMVDEDVKQEQVAKDLGISPGILSNYIAGKNIPEMEFVRKCIVRFHLQGKAVRDIFTASFSSTARSNQKIILDTRFFKTDRIDLLAQAIAVLMFYPADPKAHLMNNIDLELSNLKGNINSHFENLALQLDYLPPTEPDTQKE